MVQKCTHSGTNLITIAYLDKPNSISTAYENKRLFEHRNLSGRIEIQSDALLMSKAQNRRFKISD